MKQQAKVVLDQGKLMAEVVRPEACEACHACRYGRQERMLLELPQGQFHEGDPVDLEMPDGQVGKASLLAYGIPLLCLLLGICVGWLVGKTELFQALGALVFLGLGVLILRLLDPIIRRGSAYKPEACPCKHDDTE